MGLSVRRDLPGALHRRRDRHAGGQRRSHGPAPGRDQPQRLGRRHRPTGVGWCGLTQLAAAEPTEEHRIVAAAALCARIKSDGKRLGIHARQ